MKYQLEESETPGWWVVTDTENLITKRAACLLHVCSL